MLSSFVLFAPSFFLVTPKQRDSETARDREGRGVVVPYGDFLALQEEARRSPQGTTTQSVTSAIYAQRAESASLSESLLSCPIYYPGGARRGTATLPFGDGCKALPFGDARRLSEKEVPKGPRCLWGRRETETARQRGTEKGVVFPKGPLYSEPFGQYIAFFPSPKGSVAPLAHYIRLSPLWHIIFVFRPFGERSAVAPLVLPLAGRKADERSKKEGETLYITSRLLCPEGTSRAAQRGQRALAVFGDALRAYIAKRPPKGRKA